MRAGRQLEVDIYGASGSLGHISKQACQCGYRFACYGED
jgi:hypothetical protein